MGCFQTFFAIIKAYTSLSIFFLPMGFKQGGWLFSPIVLVIACFFETTCAIKLVQVARKYEIYNFPDIVEFALGKTYRTIFEIIAAGLSLSFTFNPLAFIMRSLYQTTFVLSGTQVPMWVFLLIVLVILAPLTWVRSIEVFRFGFVLAVSMIILMIIIVSVFDFI